jgi:phosphohistidine phosphatase
MFNAELATGLWSFVKSIVSLCRRSPAVMRVYLVQHGESKSEEEDAQRRLTDKGIGEVQNIADFLRPLKLAVDAIWHSDKARAQQTGELLSGAVWARDRLVKREGLGPKKPRRRL